METPGVVLLAGIFCCILALYKIETLEVLGIKLITKSLKPLWRVLFGLVGIFFIILAIYSLLRETITTANPTPTSAYQTTNPPTSEEIVAITPTISPNSPLTKTYLLDFKEYKDGDTLLDFGSNLIVRSAKEKYVTGLTSDGKIEIDNLNLADFFEIEIRADFTQAKVKIILGTQDGEMAILSFGENNLVVFGTTTKSWSETAWKRGNEMNSLKIISNGDGLIFLINEETFGKYLDSSYAVYTSLTITGIDQNQKIFSIRIENKE